MNKEIIRLANLIKVLECNKQERIKQAKEYLRKLPTGPLYIEKRNSRYYFSTRIGKIKTGITRNKDLVHKLARRQYLQLICDDNIQEIPELLQSYQDMGLDIKRIIYSKQQYDWMLQRQSQNQYHAEELKRETHSGTMVRTKSEQTIGNMLEEYGIPYRYEMHLEICVDEIIELTNKHYKTYYPDFTILLADGQMIIWEHFGRMDLEAYRHHYVEKVMAYRTCDVFNQLTLISTFEKDLMNDDNVIDIIEQIILPQGAI